MQDHRFDRLKDIFRLDHIGQPFQTRLYSILFQYNDVFHLDGDFLTVCPILQHKITLYTDTAPVNVKNYRLPFAQRDEIQKHVDKLLQTEVVEPSTSPFNSPLLLVPKKGVDADGKSLQRLVIDFRKLNEATIDENVCVPQIQDLIDQLSTKATVFTKIDLSSGFHQIELEEDSKPKTAFTTSQGHFSYRRMPFGLKGAPGTFLRMISIAFADLIGKILFVYVDDLVIFAKDPEEHLERLQITFQRLRDAHLKASPEKCDFMSSELLFLGHILTPNGFKPNPESTSAITKLPAPRNLKAVRSFLGMCNYYRRFIPKAAELSKPMTDLLKKDTKFLWTDDCQRSFDTFKGILTSPPILQYPDFTKPFIISCDASYTAISGVLSQGEPGNDLPIAFASRTLIDAETRYQITELEILSIVFSISQFRVYIFPNKFTLYSDNKALQWLFQVKSPNSRLIRWKMLLAGYDFEILHIKGKDNVVADCLSRYIYQALVANIRAITRSKAIKQAIPIQISPPVVFNNTQTVSPVDPTTLPLFIESSDRNLIKIYKIQVRLLSIQDLSPVKHLKLDPTTHQCGEILSDFDNDHLYIVNQQKLEDTVDFVTLTTSLITLKALIANNKIEKVTFFKADFSNTTTEYNKFKDLLTKVFIQDTVRFLLLTTMIRLLTQRDEIEQALKDFHDSPLSGHQGVKRMIGRITDQFKWPGLTKDVKEYVKKCAVCQVTKHSPKHKQPMTITTTSRLAFEICSVDLVGPLPLTPDGFRYILTFQDDLTKYFGAAALINEEADTVARQFVSQVILRYGFPQVCRSDRGTQFLSALFTSVLKLLGIKKRSTTSYRPSSNGALERSHRTLKSMIRAYADKDKTNWPEFLEYIVFVINTSVNRSTGYSSHELLLGTKLVIPNHLSKKPDPMYNYDDYAAELKFKLQTAHEFARQQQIKSKNENKHYYDQNAELDEYEIGDKILIINHAPKTKLHDLYLGPYEIIEILSDTNVKIQIGKKLKIVHKDFIKRFEE